MSDMRAFSNYDMVIESVHKNCSMLSGQSGGSGGKTMKVIIGAQR